jgi:hypothetical protein
MLKRIAIETGKQIDQELVITSKRSQNVPKGRLRRTTLEQGNQQHAHDGGHIWRILASNFSRQFKAHAN